MRTFNKKIIAIFFIIILVAVTFCGTVSAASINLALDEFRGKDSDNTYPAYGMDSQHIYKVYEVTNGTQNYNRAIYCLDAGRGFGTGTGLTLNTTTEYNQSFNMMNTTEKETIKGYETANNASFSAEDYEKVLKILKNSYISGTTDKSTFLKKMIPNYESSLYYITDKDIEVAQQLAIWHYTNESTKTNNTTFGELLKNSEIANLYQAVYSDEGKNNIDKIISYITEATKNTENYNQTLYKTSNHKYYNLKTDISDKYMELYNQEEITGSSIIPEEYKGMQNRFNGIQQIYLSMLNIAETEDSNLYNENVKPLEMDSNTANVIDEGKNYVAGPFKISKINDSFYDFASKITDSNGNIITTYSILDSSKTVTTKTIEDLIGEEFYIQFPKSISAGKVKISFTAKYDTTTVKYWTKGDAVSTTQPVAIVEKTPVEIVGEKEVEIPKGKLIDFSLRKFISAVGSKNYDREPVVDASKLIPNGSNTTARYVHSKEPVSVKVGDIVEYTIRVYNEGEADGYIGKIEDILPEELTFPTQDMSITEELKEAIEYNAGYGWKLNTTTGNIETEILSKNTDLDAMQKEICKEQNRENALIKAFDGSKLDYIDVKVKCLVNEKATPEEKITNIAQINKYENENGEEVNPDRDSTSNNFKLPDGMIQNQYEGNGNDNGYIKGQEDDDDFERLIIEKPFDLSLRKYITEIDGAKTMGRTPDIDVSKLIPNGKESTAEYNHSKKPLTVVKGSIITYTITVYNEGDIDGYVNEITDYLPEELEFVENSEINQKYKWEVSKDGRTVKTKYLQYTGSETENLLKAFDKTTNTLSSKSVEIQCKVKGTAEYGKILTNLAQITEDSDSQGNEITDRDSVPDGNFTLPKDEDLPKYKEDEENKSYVPGQEDDDDYEKVKIVYFDLALRKIVSKAIVIENGNSTVTETNHKFEDDPEEIVKVDLGRKNLKNITVKFEYQIRITNEGMIAGYAKEVKDYIPEGLKFNKEDNPLWTEVSEGVITTDQLKDELLQPGESRVVTVILTWKNNQDNLGLKVNVAEISKDYNEFNTPDIDSTPDNKVDGEDDIDDAPVMLSIILGQNTKTYFGITILMLTTAGIGIVLIKKFVL